MACCFNSGQHNTVIRYLNPLAYYVRIRCFRLHLLACLHKFQKNLVSILLVLLLQTIDMSVDKHDNNDVVGLLSQIKHLWPKHNHLIQSNIVSASIYRGIFHRLLWDKIIALIELRLFFIIST